jgi:hypothetical protein
MDGSTRRSEFSGASRTLAGACFTSSEPLADVEWQQAPTSRGDLLALCFPFVGQGVGSTCDLNAVDRDRYPPQSLLCQSGTLRSRSDVQTSTPTQSPRPSRLESHGPFERPASRGWLEARCRSCHKNERIDWPGTDVRHDAMHRKHRVHSCHSSKRYRALYRRQRSDCVFARAGFTLQTARDRP